MNSQALRLAYLAYRMPATYAAVHAVLLELKTRLPDISIHTLLDLGSGPGTVLWAAQNIFPEINNFSLVEQDLELIKIGKELTATSKHLSVQATHWVADSLLTFNPTEQSDLVTISYVLGELSDTALKKVLSTIWESAKQLIVIVEPGTPRGFEYILKARKLLIDQGGYIVAPCPHHDECPLIMGKAWCHFSQRIERSFEHKYVKKGSLGFEDEKYSYLIVAKNFQKPSPSRVIHQPEKHSGHIHMALCTKTGIKNVTISRKDGESYRLAKKVDWGDVWA